MNCVDVLMPKDALTWLSTGTATRLIVIFKSTSRKSFTHSLEGGF